MSNLSVVIPTYRRSEVLLDTVRCLLALPVAPNEVLIVDQTENHSPEMLAAFQALEEKVPDLGKTKVRRIQLTEPSIPHAMNVGLQEAMSEVVLFLDDDIIPDGNLVSIHWETHADFPEVAAVVGQVLQPEDRFQVSGGRCEKSGRGLRRDLNFRFSSDKPAWIENVMAGNLSVKKEVALRVGGFDENFIPPVSFRFETEFAKRLTATGGKIRFEPAASIRHLRAEQGGTRSRGSHLMSASPIHGVGDYYYALHCGRGVDRLGYMLFRPFREVRTRFHLTHPWFIPVKWLGELRAMGLAFRLFRGDRFLVRTVEPKRFYNAQYQGENYAAYSSAENHPFFSELQSLLSTFGQPNGRWLEVGCGRGFLQDMVSDYTGVDVAEAVAAYLHKPFFCSAAEELPFDDDEFDGAWSYAVLEHVENPEMVLTQIRRVLKSGGILFLLPAWQCRSWAGKEYAWKPDGELSALDRVRKALIPLRNSILVRACGVFPRRLMHLGMYGLKKCPIKLWSRPLVPIYTEYRVPDADACWHMDPFDVILWFRSRGDDVLSHPSLLQSFFVRSGVVVVKRGEK